MQISLPTRLTRTHSNLLVLLIIAMLMCCDGGMMAAERSAAEQVVEIAGGIHTKLVWIRAVAPPPDSWGENFMYGECKGHQLVVLDTAEGTERIFQAGPGSFANPLITRDGASVIWSDNDTKTAWIADWITGKKRQLADADCCYVLCTRWDVTTKKEWAYAYDGWSLWMNAEARKYDKNLPIEDVSKVYRFPVDQGSAAKELVWDQTVIGSYFTVSSDGKKAASVFPWPKVGIATLPNVSWENRNADGGWGCYSCLAPDDSYRFFYFQGNHKKINMFDPGKTAPREIDLTTMPGNDGKRDSVFPRWTNHPQFIVCGTPLGLNKEHPGDVYLGRFDKGFTKIEAWAQVSNHPHRDVGLSGWLENGVVAKKTKTDDKKK